VSKSTVSRILDERLPQSDNETARRVRKVAAELGYARDISAASLRRGKTMAIGVIVPRLTDTVMAMLYEAIAKACARAGRVALVATTDDNVDADRVAAESLLKRGVDGLILATARDGDDLPKVLKDRDVPFVLALRTDGESPSAVGDDRLGGYLATRHLLDLGHRRIGLIAGSEFASSSRQRAAGYREAMAEVGIAVESELSIPSAFSIEAGADAAQQLMNLEEPPTAIFTVNDNTAIGAMSALTNMGLSVPDDISLVGYNDIPIVSHLPTPLTTLRVPFEQIAAAALALLQTLMPLPRLGPWIGKVGCDGRFQRAAFYRRVILWAVRWYCRYGISYRDLEEMLAERGIDVDHTTIYRWVQRYAPEMEKRLRWFWRRGFDPSWRLDETYVKVRGKWTYLYRAVDKRGDTIDFFLSSTRSAKAAKRFLGKALRGLKDWEKPTKLNTDKAPSYGAAIAELKREGKLAPETEHRQVKYLNNVIEADHGKLKMLIKPVRGFKSMATAYATIKGFEVMRALRKGQARPWCLQPGIKGEVRLIERSFGIGPSAMTEAMGMLNEHFADAA